MHPRFAERIAKQLHIRKWKGGWKPPQLQTWLAARFPTMTPEDAKQVKDALPSNFHGTK